MRAWILAALVVVAGCGDANPYQPAGPSAVVPPNQANLAGRYIGAMSYTADGRRDFFIVRVWLEQSGHEFSGRWNSTDHFVSGTISGAFDSLAVPTTLSATWTIDAPHPQSGRCLGSAASSGIAFPIQLRANAMAFDRCAAFESVAWRLEQEYGTVATDR